MYHKIFDRMHTVIRYSIKASKHYLLIYFFHNKKRSEIRLKYITGNINDNINQSSNKTYRINENRRKKLNTS